MNDLISYHNQLLHSIFINNQMLKLIIQRFQTNNHKLLSCGINYHFSKKTDMKKKKSQAPKLAPKTITDYMSGPQQHKKNMVQVKNMQTSSQATLQEDTLKEIIIQQRTLLQKSLWEEIKPKGNQYQTLRSKIINKYMKQEQLNKYYIKRPLRYLQNIYFSLFVGNTVGLTWFQYTNAYHQIGWFYGYFIAPAATSALALLIGYNFAFWVVRNSFHTHINLQQISKAKISLISTNWRNFIELTFIASQFVALAYYLSFGCPFSIYKLQLLLATTNFAFLALNLSQILKYTGISFRRYLQDYLKIVSLSTLLILIFALYHIQITAGAKPNDIFENQSYRQRAIHLNQGYVEYLNYFKKKKYIMKENQKINPNDQD